MRGKMIALTLRPTQTHTRARAHTHTLHCTVPFFLFEQDKARYFEVVAIFFPSNTNVFPRWGKGIRNVGLSVRRPTTRPMVVLEEADVAVDSCSIVSGGGTFPSWSSATGEVLAVWSSSPPPSFGAPAEGSDDAAAAPFFLSLCCLPNKSVLPKEKFPGKTSKNFPFRFSKLGSTQAPRANWISRPLQLSRNSDPGLRADASRGNRGGCDVTGKSEGRTTGAAASFGGGLVRFRFDRDNVFDLVVVFLAILPAPFDVTPEVLALLLRFAGVAFFLAEEDVAMVECDERVGHDGSSMIGNRLFTVLPKELTVL